MKAPRHKNGPAPRWNMGTLLRTVMLVCRVRYAAAVLLASGFPTHGFAQVSADTSTPAAPAASVSMAEPEMFSIHAQFTNVTQYHPPFTSPYRGTNSLDPGHRGDETIDATLFAGVRLWDGVEFYANPEIDQGFGLSNTVGLGGYSSGEAYKIGSSDPYVRLHRAFMRINIGLGGSSEPIDPDKNQLGGTQLSDNLIITAGKFSVPDIFDNNTYAHDPRSDFLNWAIIDAGAFDYAADPWGYTYGMAAEWTQGWWTLRLGGFDLSRIPNDRYLETDFSQFSITTEVEERHSFDGQPGKFKVLLYLNRGRMANYTDAIREALGSGHAPDVSLVRRYSSRPGAALNFEQQIIPDLGVFARASLNDGHKETYEFTEINQSLSAGLALKGTRWHRPNDTFSLAGVVNGLSKDAQAYFEAGGLGILIGDGRLNYDNEEIIETYYEISLAEGFAVTADYQYIQNPAYNQDRGPVSIFGLRIHAEF